MDSVKQSLIDILKDLKENYNVVGVKTEFETEGSRFDEVQQLKKIVTEAGLNLTIKIGGCEAIRDIYDVKNIGADTIVAPMIETPYALKKFVQAIDNIFSKSEQEKVNHMINIETITGYANLNDIISSPYFSPIDGVVIGRADLASSMGLSKDDVNDDKILEIARNVSQKVQKSGKKVIVGGRVSVDSIPFFKALPYISNFETRKIIFDATINLDDKGIKQGIMKALEFEILWLKNKEKFSGIILKNDKDRLSRLESLYNRYEQICFID